MLVWLFIVSGGVKVELPKYGLCYVDSSLMLHGATCGFTLKLSLLRHLRACLRDSLHLCKYLYSMMIDCISHNKFLFSSVLIISHMNNDKMLNSILLFVPFICYSKYFLQLNY